MSAVTDTDWAAEAVRLRREEEMATNDIAERVGRSASQVRKVIAAANAARHVAGTNGNGHIDGQTTVDDFARPDSDVPPEDDPEYEAPDARDMTNLSVLDDDVDPLATFRAEAGEAVGPMQTRPGEEPPEPIDEYGPVIEEIVVSGTAQLGLFDAGGRTPDSASVRLAGGKLGLIHGEAFRKGDVIHFSGTAVVTAVKQQDKRDPKTGQVVGCEQQHTALITDLTVGGDD